MSALAVPDAAATDSPLRLWTRGEFDRLLASDVIPEDEVLLLHEGQIYRVNERNPRLWTRDEYYRLAEAGILSWDERVELLDGEIVEKMTIHPPHAVAVGKTANVLRKIFSNGYVVREQTASSASDYSEPEPDILIAPGNFDDYVDHHPILAEAALIVEVSESTLQKDRSKKARIYALAGCREYWIVNLQKRTLEVYRNPIGDAYQDKHSYAEAEIVSPLAAPGASVRVADLLPLARINKE